MTEISNIDLEFSGTERNGGPVDVKLTFDVNLSNWEIDQNQPYYARAFILEQDGNYDEFIYHPNWRWQIRDTVPDGDADEFLKYLGRKHFRPNGNTTQTLTFEGELSASDIAKTHRYHNEEVDDTGEAEEYYPFIVVEPEMHTVRMMGESVAKDFSRALL